MPRDPMPPSGSWMGSPHRGRRCTVCGQELGAEPYHVTQYPKGVHDRCRLWENEPFPFGAQLQELRRVARALQSGYRQVVEVGRLLSGLEQRWPPKSRAAQKVRHYYERRERLKTALQQLKDRLRL